MIRASFPRIFAVAALVAGLSGCGFHPRYALQLPPDLGPVRVVSVDKYSPLADTLKRSLDRIEGAVEVSTADAVEALVGGLDPEAVADPGAGIATLDILAERWGDTPIAVDQYGRSQEFTLRYATVFVLRGPDGKEVVPQQAIELSRDYLSNPDQSQGTDSEREVLVKELRREMGAAILRRIDGALSARGRVK